MRLCPRCPTLTLNRVGKIARGQCTMSSASGARLCPPCETAGVGDDHLSFPEHMERSTRLNDTVFRYETKPHQSCRDGADFTLVRRRNCSDRIARLERGT